MSFGNEDERIEKLVTTVNSLVEYQRALLNLLRKDKEMAAQMTAAALTVNEAFVKFLHENTTFSNTPECKKMYDALAEIKKNMDSIAANGVLQRLLPPLPPGLGDGSMPGT